MKSISTARLTEVNNLLNAEQSQLKAVKSNTMKKVIELQNAQTPINELRKQALAAINKYLDVANKSKRTSSDVRNALWSFLDHSADNLSDYLNVFTEALLVLSKKEVAEPFREKIGEYYFDEFAKMIERTIYMLGMLRGCEASKAEILAIELDIDGSYEKEDTFNRIHLNDIIRTYNTMAVNTEAKQADWAVYDNQL